MGAIHDKDPRSQQEFDAYVNKHIESQRGNHAGGTQNLRISKGVIKVTPAQSVGDDWQNGLICHRTY